jgi:hypothetical protein
MSWSRSTDQVALTVVTSDDPGTSINVDASTSPVIIWTCGSVVLS